jgi:hypothetical protein
MPRSPKTVFSIYQGVGNIPFSIFMYVGSFSSRKKALKWQEKNPEQSLRYHVQILEEEKPSFKVGEYITTKSGRLSRKLVFADFK